jgi:hypothetical protein
MESEKLNSESEQTMRPNIEDDDEQHLAKCKSYELIMQSPPICRHFLPLRYRAQERFLVSYIFHLFPIIRYKRRLKIKTKF